MTISDRKLFVTAIVFLGVATIHHWFRHTMGTFGLL